MATNSSAKSAGEKILKSMTVTVKDKKEIFKKITSSPEYTAYKQDQSDANKEAYKKFLKDTLNEEGVLSLFEITGSPVPPRGKMTLEEYLAGVISQGVDLEKKANEIKMFRHTEEMKTKSAEEKARKEEEIKKLTEQLSEKDAKLKDLEGKRKDLEGKTKKVEELEKQLADSDKENTDFEEQLAEKDEEIKKLEKDTRFFQGVDPSKNPLKIWRTRTKIDGGIMIRRFSVAGRLRRRRLNRLASRLNERKNNPIKGLRYIMAMTEGRYGGRGVAIIRRKVTNLLGVKWARNPATFKKNFENQITKILPDPANLQNADEKVFAQYIRDMAIYFRDKHISDLVSKYGDNINMNPQLPKVKNIMDAHKLK